MSHVLYRRILETIARYSMVRAGDRIGLGVSGGADSVAMLRIFADLQSELGITTTVLHFHHQLRGADADEDERFVNELAGKYSLPFESGRSDVAGEVRRRGWNLEDAARRLRYQFFNEVAEARGLNRVAVAHTRDDQAETLLMHLLRGTGLAGLAGIRPVARTVIRPLLDVDRTELRAFLTSLGQTWREDATNQDTSRMRARIRHQLLPLLHRDFDPAASLRLSRLAALAREDEEFWRDLEEDRFLSLAKKESHASSTGRPATVSIAIKDLLSPFPLFDSAGKRTGHGQGAATEATLAVTRRLVRRIFSELRGDRQQLTSQHVAAVLDLATKSQSGARLDLPGIRVERIFDRLVFTKVFTAAKKRDALAQTNCEFAYSVLQPDFLEPASIVVTEIHRRLSLKVVDWPSAQRETVAGRGALDFHRVRWPLVLRNWRPGDSYRPLGSRRVRKLKRLLLESRIPRNAREGWPVLTSDEKVVWASGYPVAEEFAAHKGTQIGLVIGEEEL